MTESKRFGEDISQLGLTPEDFKNRGVVAVGYGTNELLPPYNGRLHKARAEKILDHVKKSNNSATFATFSFFNADWRALFPETKVIEVVGGYTSLCVTLVVSEITNSGLFAVVNAGMTFEDRAYYPNSVLSKRLKNGVSPKAKHLKLGRGKSIFYKLGAENK